ncbi:MAG: hypothetical protein COA41_00915 [Sphingopyxis sp.]|nr:MAG: hypothetical protein COA41_00915 [Sphingopyxis sp.]
MMRLTAATCCGSSITRSKGMNDTRHYTVISRRTFDLLIASGAVEIIELGASTLVATESRRRFIN